MNTVKTVLIVDDSRISRMFIREFILAREPDWKILEAASGGEAIKAVRESAPDFVTMDLNMEGMSGFEAIEKILELTPQTRIAVLTANIQDTVRRRAETMGVLFAIKPITEAVVHQAVDYFNRTS